MAKNPSSSAATTAPPPSPAAAAAAKGKDELNLLSGKQEQAQVLTVPSQAFTLWPVEVAAVAKVKIETRVRIRDSAPSWRGRTGTVAMAAAVLGRREDGKPFLQESVEVNLGDDFTTYQRPEDLEVLTNADSD